MNVVKIAYNRKSGNFSIQGYDPLNKYWDKRPEGYRTIGVIPESIVDDTLIYLSSLADNDNGQDNNILAKMRGHMMVVLADFINSLP